MDRDHHGGPVRHPIHDSARRDRPLRTASIGARRDDRHRLCDRARIRCRRHPAPAAAGTPRLRRHRLRVDADGAADGRLCLARRGAVRPRLRAAAAVGLGGLHRRRIGMRAAGRFHRGPAPDLGHCRGGRARRCRQPRTSAARPSEDDPGGGRGLRRLAARTRFATRTRFAARTRLSRHHPGVGADPGQPRRLLQFLPPSPGRHPASAD